MSYCSTVVPIASSLLASSVSTAPWFCVTGATTVYPKKYVHGFVVLCFVVVMQSFIMNSHEVFIHIHQGCFAGTGAIIRLPQCQWSKPDGYGKISQCLTTTKHSKAKTVCIFLGIYCRSQASSESNFGARVYPYPFLLQNIQIENELVPVGTNNGNQLLYNNCSNRCMRTCHFIKPELMFKSQLLHWKGT